MDTIGKIVAALDVLVVSLISDESINIDQQNATISKINTQLMAMDEEDLHDFLRIIRIFRSNRQRKGKPEV